MGLESHLRHQHASTLVDRAAQSFPVSPVLSEVLAPPTKAGPQDQALLRIVAVRLGLPVSSQTSSCHMKFQASPSRRVCRMLMELSPSGRL